jgi:hypothetical protein
MRSNFLQKVRLYGDARTKFRRILALILERERLEGAREQLFALSVTVLSKTDEDRVEFV